VQNFAKHSGRLQSGHACQIHRRFRMTGASQHSTILGAQWKNVARLHQIFRPRLRFRDDLDRRRAIVRADAGSHAAGRIHRDGEIGAVHFAVLRHHPLQTELLRAIV
jgi:hypothetical protein